jgi:hypothetical protein
MPAQKKKKTRKKQEKHVPLREADAQETHCRKTSEGKPERHPAYGTVQVTREFQTTALFAAPDASNLHVVLKIKRATRYRDWRGDNIKSDPQSLIEITLSEMQWAEMIAKIGSANAVPCTLRSVNGRDVPECPEQKGGEQLSLGLEQETLKVMKVIADTLERANPWKAGTATYNSWSRPLRLANRKLKNVLFLAQQIQAHLNTNARGQSVNVFRSQDWDER